VLSGRYELRSVLGRGGMADVWEGFDRRLRRTVAVKILHEPDAADPSMPARFQLETRVVARLAHPNIVAIHDVGADGGMTYLVMELVRGVSLAERLTGGALGLAEAVRIAGQVCDALAAAHAAGVVHGDLKPANILLADTGGVKVVDFGIARLTGQGQTEPTASAQVLGTATYMAPEQATGWPVDARTDIYALGCVLYAMLTGHPPFTGDDPVQVAFQHVTRVPLPASASRLGLPPAVGRSLDAMLAKRPVDRPASAADVRAALAHAMPD
jgi:eukaryotic-like serine/threonine-protein kinase